MNFWGRRQKKSKVVKTVWEEEEKQNEELSDDDEDDYDSEVDKATELQGLNNVMMIVSMTSQDGSMTDYTQKVWCKEYIGNWFLDMINRKLDNPTVVPII